MLETAKVRSRISFSPTGWSVRAICTIAAFVTSTACVAADDIGPNYPTEQIVNYDLGGLKLGMTSTEAEASMKAAGYEGKFEARIRDRANAWRQVDRAIFPFRFVSKDGQTRIWYVQFQQTFDVNMSEEAVKQRVVAKYGVPSRVEGGEMIYESAWPFDRVSAQNCLGLGESHCRMGMVRNNPYKSYHELKAAYDAAANRPQLRIEIQPKRIVAHLEDRGAKEEADIFQNQQAKNAEEEKRRKSTKKLDLGL